MNNIPQKLRKEMAEDPYYKTCARANLLNDHVCECDPLTGKLIDWEHALIFGGKQVQKKWAIIPLCWWAHRGPGLVKDINVMIALNRASDADLSEISKVVDYIALRKRLNEKHGVGSPITISNNNVGMLLEKAKESSMKKYENI